MISDKQAEILSFWEHLQMIWLEILDRDSIPDIQGLAENIWELIHHNESISRLTVEMTENTSFKWFEEKQSMMSRPMRDLLKMKLKIAAKHTDLTDYFQSFIYKYSGVSLAVPLRKGGRSTVLQKGFQKKYFRNTRVFETDRGYFL